MPVIEDHVDETTYKYSDPDQAYARAKRNITNNALRRKQSKIDLSWLGLTEVPEEICLLTDILEINLRGNKISKLPECIGALKSLKRLDLGDNILDRLPNNFSELNNIETLYIDNNIFQIIPDQIYNMPSIKSIDISANMLSDVDPKIGRMINLAKIDLSGNDLEELPIELGQIRALQVIILENNNLVQVPVVLLQLNLTTINLGYNSIVELPNFLGAINSIERINLSYNNISHIPEALYNLRRLKFLDISGNKVSRLTRGMENLSNLENLGLQNCGLADFPREILNLRNLQYLNLSGNQISSIPSSISSLIKLKLLDISDNDIENLPESMGRMSNLTTDFDDRKQYSGGLFFRKNPLEYPLDKISLYEQPYQTTRALEYLRGELDLSKVEAQLGLPLDTDEDHGHDEISPLEPSLEDGPTFRVQKGVIDLNNIPTGTQNYDLDTQTALKRRVEKRISSLLAETVKVNNQYPDLYNVVQEYSEIVSENIEEIDIVGLWAVGNALMAQAASFDGQNTSRTLTDPLEPMHKAVLIDVARLHGGFVQGFQKARELTEKADHAKIPLTITEEIREPTIGVLRNLSGQIEILSSRARNLTRALEEALLVAGWSIARVGYSSYATLRNILIEIGRVISIANEKGGTLIGSSIAIYAGLDPQAIIAIAKFLTTNSSEIISFAAPFPELRTWLKWIIDHVEREKYVNSKSLER